MAKITLRMSDSGKLEGLTPADVRAYARFRDDMAGLSPGDTITFEYRVPRSPRFHRRHFALLGLFFDNQGRFDDPVSFRKWIEVGAGHVQFVPGAYGELVAIPLSIAYDALDDTEFFTLHQNVVAFLRSAHAARFLWPDVPVAQAAEAVEVLFLEFKA